MAAKDLPSPELIRKLVDYDPSTGVMTWRKRPEDMFTGDCAQREQTARLWNARRAGKRVGGVKDHGYEKCCFLRSYLYVHRLAWAYYHGEWPQGEIDHINHDRSDNRIANLRIVDRAENCRNASLSKNNKSGVCGVFWDKKVGKWHAYIRKNGVQHNLGFYSCKQAAIAARKAAEGELGFHENHGRPSRLADGRTPAQVRPHYEAKASAE